MAKLYGGLGLCGGLILAAMTAAVFLQVVLRWLGASAIDGIDEIPRYLFVWLVMIGAAAAMQRGEHTSLDYFVNLLPTRGRVLVGIITNAVCIAIFLYLIKSSFTLIPNADLQTSAGLNLPLSYVFAAIPIGSFLIIVPLVRNVLNGIVSLWQKPSS